MNESPSAFHSSLIIHRSSFLKRESRARHPALVRNPAAVRAYDSCGERQAQPRAAREAAKRVFLRARREDAAPLDQAEAPARRLLLAQPNLRRAFFARARFNAAAGSDILQSFREQVRVEVAFVRAAVRFDARAFGGVPCEAREVCAGLSSQF